EEGGGEGAEYLDQTRLDSMRAAPGGGGGWVLEGERGGRRLALAARFVADATGPAGFLHRALALPAGSFASLPDTQALYTHFSGGRRVRQARIFESAGAPAWPLA